MGVLVHPDRQAHPAVQRALSGGRLRVVASHGSGHPWLLARPGERSLTEVRTKYLDIVILSHLDGDTASAVVRLVHGKRALEELDDLPALLSEPVIVIAKDQSGGVRVEGSGAGSRRAVWLEEGEVAFVSDEPSLLTEVFSPSPGRPDLGDSVQHRTVPRGMWLHAAAGLTPRVRAVSGG